MAQNIEAMRSEVILEFNLKIDELNQRNNESKEILSKKDFFREYDRNQKEVIVLIKETDHWIEETRIENY